MRFDRTVLMLCLVAMVVGGCQATATNQATYKAQPLRAKRTVSAHINDQPVSQRQLRAALIEYGGGMILAELILDRQVRKRLAERGRKLTAALIDTERELMSKALHSDPVMAGKLLAELRRRRGLGRQRFTRQLIRNAGLRLLIKDEVHVSEAVVRQAFEIAYGVKYRARLIVVESPSLAAKIIHEAEAGALFVDLVAAHSIDHRSRLNEGLIGPVSPADPTYPKAVRQALRQLEPGQISAAIALDRGFAVLELVSKIVAMDLSFDDVKTTLGDKVQLQLERRAMRRLARTLLEEAEVVIGDPVLAKSWEQYRRGATAP